jgi:hypothetical protein
MAARPRASALTGGLDGFKTLFMPDAWHALELIEDIAAVMHQ